MAYGVAATATRGGEPMIPCRETDPDVFFHNAPLARKICKDCPVRQDCENLIHKIEIKLGRQHGVWAGLSKHDRRQKWACREDR
jgi:Transcription factor WhiB